MLAQKRFAELLDVRWIVKQNDIRLDESNDELHGRKVLNTTNVEGL